MWDLMAGMAFDFGVELVPILMQTLARRQVSESFTTKRSG
jgi:hypothetical protein